MAQGIMTGIGFLGAGVIKEGTTVRGLTTAATIWITSAIGILIGIGFFVPAIAGAPCTLVVLSGLRRMESRLPRTFNASLAVRFDREMALSEAELRDMVTRHGFSVQNFSYRLIAGGDVIEYLASIRNRRSISLDGISSSLRELAAVKEFRIATRQATDGRALTFQRR